MPYSETDESLEETREHPLMQMMTESLIAAGIPREEAWLKFKDEYRNVNKERGFVQDDGTTIFPKNYAYIASAQA